MRTAFALTMTAGLASLVLGSAPQASASTFVIGAGAAHECALAALAGAFSEAAAQLCTTAIDTENLNTLDRARTYVNRGVINMRRSNFPSAARDLDMAQHLAPALPEVFVNRGALFLREDRFADSIAETDRALALNPEQPAKAYFNRALARELSNDLQGAYMDFRKAAEIAPDWPEPKLQMARFIVKKRGE